MIVIKYSGKISQGNGECLLNKTGVAIVCVGTSVCVLKWKCIKEKKFK